MIDDELKRSMNLWLTALAAMALLPLGALIALGIRLDSRAGRCTARPASGATAGPSA